MLQKTKICHMVKLSINSQRKLGRPQGHENLGFVNWGIGGKTGNGIILIVDRTFLYLRKKIEWNCVTLTIFDDRC